MTDKKDPAEYQKNIQNEMEGVIKTAILAQENLKLESGFFDEVVFNQCLSTSGLTAGVVKNVRATDAAFICATTKTWGEHAIGEMEKNNQLLTASAEFDMLGGKNTQVVVDRTGTISTGVGKPLVDAYGVTNVNVKDKGVKGPELKSIRAGLRDLGNAKLAKQNE
jgi:hypothetical protein